MQVNKLCAYVRVRVCMCVNTQISTPYFSASGRFIYQGHSKHIVPNLIIYNVSSKH